MTITLSDDTVVGDLVKDADRQFPEHNEVRFSDLSPHIQDRLRAAEEMRESARAFLTIWDDHLFSDKQRAEAEVGLRNDIAAYEATFKEPTK